MRRRPSTISLPDNQEVVNTIKSLARSQALKRLPNRSFVGEAQMYCHRCRRVTTFEVTITKFAGVVFAFCDTENGAEFCNFEITEETRLAVAAARARQSPTIGEVYADK